MTLTEWDAILFDMDNTLFDELTYFKRAFEDIAEIISNEKDLLKTTVFDRILLEFNKKGSQYDQFFFYVAQMFDLDDRYHDVFYETYLTIDVELELYDDAERILQWIQTEGYPLGLITSGSIRAQRNKIESLGIEQRFEEVCVPRELEDECEKPSAEPYQYVVDQLGVDGSRCMYVGDNPLTDFQGSKELGMTTVRLHRGEFSGHQENEHLIDYSIDNHQQLQTILASQDD